MLWNYRKGFNRMSYALYNVGGLRFWRQNEVRLRNRIKDALTDCVTETLLNLNQMWRFEEVDSPVLMPREMFSCAYDENDIFILHDQIGGKEYALRAETTIGSYKIAEQILNEGAMRLPLCIYTAGQSFRQERSDGATAAKLRFNAFYQLEYQCIYAKPWVDENGKQRGTTAPIASTVRNALVHEVSKITGLDTRLIPSDRLPTYSEETIDIEVFWNNQWKEVASTSIRTDFPPINKLKDPMAVFEVAFGLDRMVAVTQGRI